MMTDEPRVTMDKSKYYSTVHGERGPDDIHAAIQFYQQGLPFDAHGHMVADAPDFEPGRERPSQKAMALRSLAEKKLEKAAKTFKPRRAPAPRDEDEDEVEAGATVDEFGNPIARLDDEGDEDDGPSIDDVDLVKWLQGENYVWLLVSQRIAGLYKRRVNNIKDAVEFLVDEQKIAPKGILAPKYLKLLA